MKNKTVFLDIDTQYDFMNPNGALYVSGAKGLIPNLKRLFRFAQNNNIPVISSLDTHRRDDPEFKQFPPHCIKGTRGYKKIKQTLKKGAKQIFIIKHTFDVFSNLRIKTILKPYGIAYVFGVALDYCVKAACLGLVKLGKKTYLVTDATQAVTAKGKQETLRLLRQKGVIFVKTEGVIKRLKRITK
jgi:nicotinamidase/pyrazinamidase